MVISLHLTPVFKKFTLMCQDVFFLYLHCSSEYISCLLSTWKYWQLSLFHIQEMACLRSCTYIVMGCFYSTVILCHATLPGNQQQYKRAPIHLSCQHILLSNLLMKANFSWQLF